MRYNAFFGELPINAFKPIGGKMTLHGGGNPVSAVTDAVSDAVGTVADVAGNAVDTVGNAVGNVVDTVKNHPLEAAALAAGGYYFAPEIGAWIGSDGTALAGTEAGVAAGAGEMTAAETNAMIAAEQASAGGAGAALGAGAAAGAGAGAGSSLASMLPYMAGGQIATGLLQANSAKEAAQIQADAAAKAQAQQQANFELINKQQAPYRSAGYGALNQIANLGGGGGVQYDSNGNVIGNTTGSSDYLTHQFNAADLKAGLAPNYDFMLQQGQMANQRAANVGGGSLGGNALQGLNKFTQDYAGNAYQNAFNNYQTQRGNIYNTLAGIAGIGQAGQTATNTAATNATNAASQLGVGSAAAQAAGTTGATNALANTAGNVINNYTLASLLNQGGRVAP
jgi:hypothetical protein